MHCLLYERAKKNPIFMQMDCPVITITKWCYYVIQLQMVFFKLQPKCHSYYWLVFIVGTLK